MNEKGVFSVDINKEMRGSYLQYSMSVIVGRALPDVRDGLKPVHRRILFAMKDLNNTHDKPFKKSARVVGDVIGKYHPHGDMAVYDSIVRMAQDFSMRAPLIDGQGNFGSIDGDSAAAPRYTEIRMTALAEELLKDIDKQTVPFGPNYDDSLLIPSVLPARYPNLLVNGSAGIAVGMACNIPPHNLGELISACLLLLDRPEVEIDELMEVLPGPDFPTSGLVEGKSAIRSAYRTGRGVISLNSVSEIEEEDGGKSSPSRIVIKEIPYLVNKARLIESIAGLVKEKRVEGVTDLRDESSREGLRIVVFVKRGFNPKVVLNQIQKHSQLRTSFGIIFLALDKNHQPKVFNLKEMLERFIEHRKEMISRRLIFDLKKAQEKLHILEGLKKALSSIDRVIALVKGSKNTQEARSRLLTELDFSYRQAQAILEMRIQKLTSLERDSLEEERVKTEKLVKDLKDKLSSGKKIEGILKEELLEIKEKYAEPRRTQIKESAEDLEDRDLISKKPVILFLTYKGLVKRIPLEEYRLQKRGGKGLKGWELRNEGDFVHKVWSVNTLDRLLVFTSMGRLHWLDVYRAPSGLRQTKARSLKNLLSFKEGEEPRLVLPLREPSKGAFIVSVTKKGIVKKSSLSLFSRPRAGGVNALSVGSEDSLQDVQLVQTTAEEDVIELKGQGSDLKTTGIEETSLETDQKDEQGGEQREQQGDEQPTEQETKKSLENRQEKLNGQNHKQDHSQDPTEQETEERTETQLESRKDLEAVETNRGNKDLLIYTKKGSAIRIKSQSVRPTGRGAIGVRALKLSKEDAVASLLILDRQDKGHILVITEKGYGKRVKASEFRVQNRGGKGVLGQKITAKTGDVVCALLAPEGRHVLITTNQGQSIRFPLNSVSAFGRNSQGVRFIHLKSGECVTGSALVEEMGESGADESELKETADQEKASD